MTPIESYFDSIFCISLKRREDRRAHAEAEFKTLGISPDSVTWFEGYDKPIFDGRPQGHAGCTNSHRALYEIIAHEKIPRALILEDDFTSAYTDHRCRQKIDPQAVFSSYLGELPTRWDLLYLGRHFANMPIAFRSPHVVKIDRMLTTSSYGITCEFARKIAPFIYGVGPIDILLSGFTAENECYTVEPPCFVQWTNPSDITGENNRNEVPMMDRNHIDALRAGRVYPAPK